MIDKSIDEDQPSGEPEALGDNVRVYVPLDINSFAIQRRLNSIIKSLSKPATRPSPATWHTSMTGKRIIRMHGTILTNRRNGTAPPHAHLRLS